jgi:hypothetical protein
VTGLDSPLPDAVREVCTTWLHEIDAAAPGLVTGLHVRGGIGFGEFVPGQSDVDFVAVLSRRATYADEDALEDAHVATQARHPEPAFDGMHLTAEDLAGDPEDCPDVPCVLHGHFEGAARYDLSPVGWHELARHSVAVRGELPPVWTDDERLLAFTRDNLDTYWRQQAEALAKFPAEAAAADACAWCVLGVARLDHLLVTGAMTTKSAAGRWGLTHYDERWHRVLREALRVRENGAGGAAPSEYDDPPDRAADVTAFTAFVVR